MNNETIKLFKKIVGADNILDKEEDLICYSYDGTLLYRYKPDVVLLPGSESEVTEIVKVAAKNKIPVVPRGSGTGLSGGAVPFKGGIVLKTVRLNRILEIDHQNLTALVEPGVITSDIHREVEKFGLFYPPDPASMNISTIGGNVAENAGGLRGLKYGITEDYILGLSGIFPNGKVFNIGGKNVKDVAGYNLKKLIIGSEGTLGIITKVLLKLIPKPEFTKTIMVQYKNILDASDTVSDIIASGILPCTLEFMDNVTIQSVEDFLRIGLPKNIEALLLIELDGYKEIVEKESEKVSSCVEKHHPYKISIAENEEEALRLTEARRVSFSALARQKPTTILEDLTVPRDKLTEIIAAIKDIATKYNLKIGVFGHIGDGNIHPTCLTDERDREEIEKVKKAFDDIYKKTLDLGGTITGEHGIGISKKEYFRKYIDPQLYNLMKEIKRVFDPDNIFNPGKIFD